MADLEVTMSVEKIIHDMLTEVAKKIQEKYSISIETVDFEWSPVLMIAGDRVINLTGVRVGTKTEPNI